MLSFLSNRRLRVVLDGKSSQEFWVNSVVPRGFILRLTLFFLYINDHSKCDEASDQWLISLVQLMWKLMGLFLPPRKCKTCFVLRPCISINLPYGLVWSTVVMCGLMLRVCGTVVPSLAVSCEPLAHRGNVASLTLFYRYYFGRCLSELVELIPLPYFSGRSARYSNRF